MDYVYLDTNLESILPEFERHDTFAIDLETTGLSPIDSRILLCQIAFGTEEERAYVINVGEVSLDPIYPFLESRKWLKIIQNAKFEGRFIQWFGKTEINNVFDTNIAEQLIDTETKKSNLEFLADKYCGITLDKNVRKTFMGMRPMQMFSDKQLQYAAEDVVILFPIYWAQKMELRKNGLDKVAEIEFDLTNVVAAMENEGIPIDVAKWKKALAETEKEHEESRLKMHSLIFDNTDIPEQMGLFVRDGINLNSQPKIKESLKALGIDIPRNDKGKESTDERALSLINHPVAKELLEYRGLQKIISSYGSSFIDKIHPFTGRIHPDFQQIGTETGRFSCREPNVQQIPEQFRGCVGLEGYKIIAADYSQMELRILAQLSKEPLLISALRSGQDLHKSTATVMFNLKMSEVTKEQRFIAKTLNFGITYGMGPTKLVDMLNAEAGKNGWATYTFDDAKRLLTQYKNTYKVASAWLRNTGERAYAQGFSLTLLDRKRTYTRPFGLDDDAMKKQVAAIKRKGANSPVQGTNADITKLAMVNLHSDIKKFGYRAAIINQVHDEIVVLAHNSQVEAIKVLIEESMLESAQTVITEVPVVVDTKISDYWEKG